jgi:tetratricopeptide (TPR) repeat protein
MSGPALCLAVAGFLFLLGDLPVLAQQEPTALQHGGSRADRQEAAGGRAGEQGGNHARPPAEQMAAMVAQLARDRGVGSAPLFSVLARLGKVGVPEAQLRARLDNAVDQLLELRAQLTRPSGERPELAAIRSEALGLLDRGDLGGARSVLEKGRAVARDLREEASRSEAELLADAARIDHLKVEYHAAAAKYGEAALLMSTDPHRRWHLVMQQAREFSDQGNEFADNQALRDAIEAYRHALALVPRLMRRLEWAATQNALGNALQVLGGRESGTERLDEAVAAYRAALQERTRERVPLDWAMTQNNLGLALERLRAREDGTERLRDAVAAYRAALQEYTRDRVPLDWAMTQNNLGNALLRLGDRENSVERLEEAIAAYRAALQERTRERVPLDWAATQNNLGIALLRLAAWESGTERLKEALSAFRAALEERTRERVPLDWAATQTNLDVVLMILNNRNDGPSRR